MPLYEYQCDACGHRFEVIQKFSDAAIATCDKCGGPVRKLLSSPAIQFKGSGWYITDYARAGKSESSTKDGGSSPGDAKTDTKPDAKSDTKSESKPETKSESKSDSKPAAPSTS
jgi:putative FmdB family regulatory protein